MNRYAEITEKMPREFVLLQGTGCRWGKCTFCDYHTDKSNVPSELNKKILSQVTGKFGILDIINSGSAMELDTETIFAIQKLVKEKHIHTIWFESHYMYRNKLSDFAKQFAPTKVKFRCGIESFDGNLRNKWNKGIPQNISAEVISKYFQGICLLICTKDHTKEQILNDISIAKKHFEYFSVNVFCNNSTSVQRDENLVEWFTNEVFPSIKDEKKIEILLKNTDLNVG
ncbi:MAG: hypothetical protein J6Q47_04705 [Paludibacteraceae bacterium]|nr:hypothetical protein [Paludibacteraceae bacterium]